MDYSKYENRIGYPKRPKRCCFKCGEMFASTANFCQNCGEEVVEIFKAQIREYDKSKKEWGDEEARLGQSFKIDAIEEAGLTGHEAAGRAYSYAWEMGHSAGYPEVMSYLYGIADVLIG